jgi:hypothetical protein
VGASRLSRQNDPETVCVARCDLQAQDRALRYELIAPKRISRTVSTVMGLDKAHETTRVSERRGRRRW